VPSGSNSVITSVDVLVSLFEMSWLGANVPPPSWETATAASSSPPNVLSSQPTTTRPFGASVAHG
jgi:hypothetical protein